jgi:hypothetical protein
MGLSWKQWGKGKAREARRIVFFRARGRDPYGRRLFWLRGICHSTRSEGTRTNLEKLEEHQMQNPQQPTGGAADQARGSLAVVAPPWPERFLIRLVLIGHFLSVGIAESSVKPQSLNGAAVKQSGGAAEAAPVDGSAAILGRSQTKLK